MDAPLTATRWPQFYGPLLGALLGNAAAIQGAALTNREAYHVVSALSILLIVLFARTVNMQHAVSPRRRIAALLTLVILLPGLLAGTANVMRALMPFLPILQPSTPNAPSPTDPFIPVPFRQQQRQPSSVRLHLAVPSPRVSIVAEPPGIDPSRLSDAERSNLPRPREPRPRGNPHRALPAARHADIQDRRARPVRNLIPHRQPPNVR